MSSWGCLNIIRLKLFDNNIIGRLSTCSCGKRNVGQRAIIKRSTSPIRCNQRTIFVLVFIEIKNSATIIYVNFDAPIPKTRINGVTDPIRIKVLELIGFKSSRYRRGLLVSEGDRDRFLFLKLNRDEITTLNAILRFTFNKINVAEKIAWPVARGLRNRIGSRRSAIADDIDELAKSQ